MLTLIWILGAQWLGLGSDCPHCSNQSLPRCDLPRCDLLRCDLLDSHLKGPPSARLLRLTSSVCDIEDSSYVASQTELTFLSFQNCIWTETKLTHEGSREIALSLENPLGEVLNVSKAILWRTCLLSLPSLHPKTCKGKGLL